MFKITLVLLTLTIFVTADIGHVKQTHRLQAMCSRPGVWPHPEDCRLFSVCVIDLQGNIRGQLYLCPTNQVYSTIYRRCTSRTLAPNCMKTNPTFKEAAEFSSANRILSEGDESPTSKQHTCNRVAVPYCADSDTLVVCGPNKARIGIVQCSGKTLSTNKEQRESRCVADVCVQNEGDHKEDSNERANLQPVNLAGTVPLGISTSTQPSANSNSHRNNKSFSVNTENGEASRNNTNATIHNTRGYSLYNSVSLISNKFPWVVSSTSDNEHEGSCKKPGIQCADYSNDTLIECSSNLKVVGEWNCENLFSKESFEDIDSVMIECDSRQGSCIAFVNARDIWDTDYDSEEEFESIFKHYTPVKNQNITLDEVDSRPQEANFEDMPDFKCLRNGIQCADDKTIMSCTDNESEPAFAMSCSDMIQILDNEDAAGYCDVEVSACVLLVNKFKVPLELSLFDAADHHLECKQGELVCADNVTLVACSGDTVTGNYAISCGSRDAKGPLSYCDPAINSCIVDPKAMDQPESNLDARSLEETYSSSFPTNYNGNELLNNDLLDYSCKFSGWQCMNDETIALCSDNLQVHGYLQCSEALHTSNANAMCDSNRNKCVLRPADTTAKQASPHCRTRGAQCFDSKHMAFCTSELQLDYVLPCKQFYPNDPNPVCDKKMSTCLPSSPVSRWFPPIPSNIAAQKSQQPTTTIAITPTQESTS